MKNSYRDQILVQPKFNWIDDIMVADNVIMQERCQALIKKFHEKENDEVIRGHVSHEEAAAVTSDDFLVAKDIHLADHERWHDTLLNYHKEIIVPVLSEYCSRYKWVIRSESQVHPETCIMSLYEKDRGKFCPHQDALAGLKPQRSVTIIAYLNSVEDGGETDFFNQGIRISPVEGRIVIFPSNFVYSHQGCIPRSNDKYITVSFANIDIGDESKVEALQRYRDNVPQKVDNTK